MAVWLSLSVSQGTPNESTRTTTVTASVIVHYSGGSHNGYSPPGVLTIDGQSFAFTCNFNYAGIGQGAVTKEEGSVTAFTTTVTVAYGSYSTRTVYVSASFDSGTGSGTVAASDSIALTSISGSGSSGGSGGGDDGGDGDGTGGDDSGSGGSGGGDDGGDDWGDDEGDDEGDDGGSGGGENENWEIVPGNADVIGQDGTEPYYSGTYSFDVMVPVGSSFNNPYVAAIIAFRTPKLARRSTAVYVELQASSTTEPAPLKIALCSSDYNRDKYAGAASDVDDEHQISTESLASIHKNDSGAIYEATLSAPGLESESIYYLVVWWPTDYTGVNTGPKTIATARNHAITVLTEDGGQGVLYIDTGAKLEKYGLYIDNGTTWDAAAPYIDDGTKWNEY